MLLRLLARARAQVDLAETEVAVGDEGAHAEPLGERQRLAILSLAALGIELVGVGCDIAEQVPRMGLEPRLGRTEIERAFAETLRLVALADQQTGARERVIKPGKIREQSVRRETLEEGLAFPQPVQCLTRLAALRQRPGGRGDSPGEVEEKGPGPGHGDPALNPEECLTPIALEDMKHARREQSHADGKGMPGRFGDFDRLGFVFGCFGKSSELCKNS